MAFESIAANIDFIEKALGEKKSPRAIAKELGNPGLYQTIRRYKIAVFDLNREADVAWRIERTKSHEQRIAEGKAQIVDTMEVLNLAKLRAKQLLSLELGDEYTTADGDLRKLSLASAAIYWQTGQKMMCELSRTEQELAGDDPSSRAAENFLELVELAARNRGGDNS
jgi:hypothetical protein